MPIGNPFAQAAIHAGMGAAIGGVTSRGDSSEFGKQALIGGLSAGASKYFGVKFCNKEALGTPEDFIKRLAVGGSVGAIAASYRTQRGHILNIKY
jgi:hypothetical protein